VPRDSLLYIVVDVDAGLVTASGEQVDQFVLPREGGYQVSLVRCAMPQRGVN
jgi:hypothetical protein